MFEKMRKCLDDFENTLKKNENELTKEEEDNIIYFYLNFAKAMLSECPDVDMIGRIIVAKHGLLDDIKFKFGGLKT